MGRQGENPQPDRESTQRSGIRAARIPMRPALLVFALAAATTVVAAQQPGIDSPSKALEGRWKLELYLDKPSARVEPMAGQINGEIGFSTLAWWNPSDRFGRHTLNLQSFFGNTFRRTDVAAFTPADTSMVTEVSGYVRGDSVGIDFIPRVDHGGLSMWGRFWGDSAKGRWYRRGTDGEGHFVLRRLSKDPVTVALIPDGRPTVVAAAAAAPAKKLTKAEARALARKEAAAKAKARSDSMALARAEKLKKAKDEALAKAAARDSAKALALAEAKAKKAAQDSVRAQTVADAKAKREAASQAKLATTTPAKPAESTPQAVTTVASSGGSTPAGSASASKGALPNALASSPTAGDSRTSRGSAAATPVRVASATPPAAAATRTPAPDAASAPSTDASAVPLRVRIFDEASKKYFVTTYSLHLPDGHWMYGKLRTGNGPDGFGPAVPRTPGKYEIEITNFMCGDKLWFFKDKILQTVEVAPGTPADVTINVNLPEAPARPSLENKAGEKCTVPVS